jgi:hypothetical protein
VAAIRSAGTRTACPVCKRLATVKMVISVPLSVCVVTFGSGHHGFAKRTATVQQSHSHVEAHLTSRKAIAACV